MRRIAKPALATLAAALLLPLFAAPAFAATSTPARLGVNSSAAAKAQPLTDLAVSAGQVYSSYGDFDRNIGPVDLSSVDVSTGAETKHLTVEGEELKALRVFDRAVYTADIDPRTAWTANTGFASNGSGSWAYNAVTPFIHVFDVAKSGGELFLAGSVVNPDKKKYGPAPYLAAVKKSSDGGRTWTIERARASASGSNDADRYYWLAAASSGRVAAIAEVRDAKGAPNRILDVYSAGRWSSIDLGSSAGYAMVHDPADVEVLGSRILIARYNSLVYIDLDAKGKTGGVKFARWPGDVGIADITVSNGIAYAVGKRMAGTGIDHGTNLVYASRDGVTWSQVAAPAVLPPTTYWDHGDGTMIPGYGAYTSIAVAGGRMYLGGTDAGVYEAAAPLVP
ncbi:hypothetical protein [Microbacterium sp.]|uniref:hypothetical protein n=1 Tax=Microbacterium sp. TaxID=51671 RepID=UPI002810D1F4|nr:hypothetical protein [Microbacterium sp.]